MEHKFWWRILFGGDCHGDSSIRVSSLVKRFAPPADVESQPKHEAQATLERLSGHVPTRLLRLYGLYGEVQTLRVPALRSAH